MSEEQLWSSGEESGMSEERFYGMGRPLEWFPLYPADILTPRFHNSTDTSVRLWLTLTCSAALEGNGGRFVKARLWSDTQWSFYHADKEEIDWMIEGGLMHADGDDLLLYRWENLAHAEIAVDESRTSGSKGGKKAAANRRSRKRDVPNA